jgi:hypothetical protein
LDRKELLCLYEAKLRDIHFYIDQHNKRVAFFIGLIVAIATGIAIGTVQARGIVAQLLLLLLPLLLTVVARAAQMGTRRLYRNYLITITMMAKLEHDLGLDRPRTGSTWAEREPYVFSDHLNSRSNSTSSAFVEANLRQGYRAVLDQLFNLTRQVGWVVLCLLILRLFCDILVWCKNWIFCLLTHCL